MLMESQARPVANDIRTTRLDAFVIGAGFGGMYTLSRLRGMGLQVSAIEGGDNVGGTWS